MKGLKLSSKKFYFKGKDRYILFKYFKDKNYYINETDLENVLKFNSLKQARDYLREKGVKL
jgi:hypothetical protein